MALNLVNETSDFLPYVKYNVKAGRWYLKDDTEVQNPVFVADFKNIKTGWFFFKAASAPRKVYDISLTEKAPKPSDTFVDAKGITRDCFKRGFELNLFSNAHFGGLVVLTGNSMHLNKAISELYNQYETSEEQKTGKLPVVEFTGSITVKDKEGTNFAPVFKIAKWIDRPVEFDTKTEAVPPAAPAPVKKAVNEF